MSKVPGLDIFKRQIISRPLLRAGMDLDSRPHSEMLKKVSTLKCCKMQFAHPKDVGVLRHVHLFVYFVLQMCCAMCSWEFNIYKERKKEKPAVGTSETVLTHQLTDNLKARDASKKERKKKGPAVGTSGSR